MTEEQGITTRRGFLKAAAITAATATVAGGGAAALSKELGLTGGSQATPLAVVSSPSTVNSVASTVATAPPVVQKVVTSSNANQLVTDLASATGDKVRLESELNAAREKIALLEQSLVEKETLQAATMQQLDESNQQIGVLGGLVALYEQLDEVDVSDFVAEGLSEVGATISGIIDEIPSVQEGLQAGRAALDNLEGEIPLMEGGRLWLLAQIVQMQALFAGVMNMLEAAADNAGPLLDMMANWAKKVLRWLPFGFGQTTATLIDAITLLLDATPNTVDGAQINVAQPLEMWLGKPDEPDVPLVSKVVTPLRTKVIDSAENHLARTSTLRSTYSAKVQEPIKLAQENRDRIRASITAYRQQNGL